GNLVKSSLRSIIFNDPYERQKLNNFSHPVILKEISALARKNSGVSFVEIPLLMESGAKWLFDKTILVLASDSLRAERVALRDSISLADAYAIIQAQHCEEEIEADAIIQNSSCVTALRQEIKTALALLEIEPQIK
ncbi:MAG: dephospho-CoA kinase, partial [Firmicutes bacterium]|nr:dephospho-CoA kinase [Bacillota bacterium]